MAHHMFKQTSLSESDWAALAKHDRTNLLPSLQTQSLSEMKGKQHCCNPSKWPTPAAFHAAGLLISTLLLTSFCLPLFLNLSSSLPFIGKPVWLDFKHAEHFIPESWDHALIILGCLWGFSGTDQSASVALNIKNCQVLRASNQCLIKSHWRILWSVSSWF